METTSARFGLNARRNAAALRSVGRIDQTGAPRVLEHIGAWTDARQVRFRRDFNFADGDLHEIGEEIVKLAVLPEFVFMSERAIEDGSLLFFARPNARERRAIVALIRFSYRQFGETRERAYQARNSYWRTILRGV